MPPEPGLGVRHHPPNPQILREVLRFPYLPGHWANWAFEIAGEESSTFTFTKGGSELAALWLTRTSIPACAHADMPVVTALL